MFLWKSWNCFKITWRFFTQFDKPVHRHFMKTNIRGVWWAEYKWPDSDITCGFKQGRLNLEVLQLLNILFGSINTSIILCNCIFSSWRQFSSCCRQITGFFRDRAGSDHSDSWCRESGVLQKEELVVPWEHACLRADTQFLALLIQNLASPEFLIFFPSLTDSSFDFYFLLFNLVQY